MQFGMSTPKCDALLTDKTSLCPSLRLIEYQCHASLTSTAGIIAPTAPLCALPMFLFEVMIDSISIHVPRKMQLQL